MNTPTRLPLNIGQQDCADGFFKFLLGDQREMIISGPAGVGKTFLMGYLIDVVMPQYQDMCKLAGMPIKYTQCEMTATTNKAADVLATATNNPASTIHSYLALRVKNDYGTGRTSLTKSAGWMVKENTILFVDECSMIDTDLRRMLLEGMYNSKIIYVGDHCQLAPVMETLSPIYRDNLPMYELTEPMRNKGRPALVALCHQLREQVKTLDFQPIQIVPGVIDHFSDFEMKDYLDLAFLDPEIDARILAYTNAKVMEYNDYIRRVRQLPDTFVVGEHLINNSAVEVKIGQERVMLKVEEEVTIDQIDSVSEMYPIHDGTELEIRRAEISTKWATKVPVMLPVDRDHYDALVKYYANQRNWNRHFFLKEKFPDLRPRDAATVHKAQGSTYDTVVIDLGNLSTCRQADQAARLLFVAASRARTRVILYGNLADKYGGLLPA